MYVDQNDFLHLIISRIESHKNGYPEQNKVINQIIQSISFKLYSINLNGTTMVKETTEFILFNHSQSLLLRVKTRNIS